MAVTYERVNWEDAPSIETPLSAENLNVMDEGIESLAEQTNDLETNFEDLDDRQAALERRMDLIASIPDTAIDQRTIAELKDIRAGHDGSAYTTAGNAVRGQINDLLLQIRELTAQAEALSARVDAIIATGEEATEGNSELLDIRTGYDGTEYLTAGTAVREQISTVIEMAEHADNSIELTQAEYDALSDEEKNNGTTYYITDSGGERDAITVTYDNEMSQLEATNLQDAIDEVVANLASTASDLSDDIDAANAMNWVLNRGEAIPENADLNDYFTPGIYYSENSVRSQTLANCPITAGGFKLLVIPTTYNAITNYGVQLIIAGTVQYNAIWIRSHNASISEWTSWRNLARADQDALFCVGVSYDQLREKATSLSGNTPALVYLTDSLLTTLTGGSVTGSSFRGIMCRSAGSVFDFVGSSGAGQTFIHLRLTMEASGPTVQSLRRVPMSADPLVKIVVYSFAYSNLAAGTALGITPTELGVSVPSGYSTLAIRAISSGNSNVVLVRATPFSSDASCVVIRNMSSSAQSGTVTLSVSYIRSDSVTVT